MNITTITTIIRLNMSHKQGFKLNINNNHKYNKLIKYEYEEDFIIKECMKFINAKKPRFLYNFNKYDLISPKNQSLITDDNVINRFYGNNKIKYYNNKPLIGFTDYNAYYPENFYSLWELINKFNIIKNIDDIAFIDEGYYNYFGHIEAIIKYNEENLHCEDINYQRILLGSDNKSKYYNHFASVYKHKIHEYKFLDNKIFFDLIVCNCFNIINNLVSLLICRKESTCIIHIRDYINENNLKLINYISSNFKKSYLVKPSVVNPLDTCSYLVCEGFHGVNKDIIKNMINDRLIHDINVDKMFISLFSNYLEYVIEFMDSPIGDPIGDPMCNNEKNILYATKWSNRYKLKIKSLYDKDQSHEYTRNYESYTLKNYNLLDIEPNNIIMHELYNLKGIINKWERLIDTQEKYIENNIDDYIIDWNNLTTCMDEYRDLKWMLMWKYNCEITSSSWMKIYEILHNERLEAKKTFQIYDNKCSVTLSVNHFLKNNDWYMHTSNNKNNILLHEYGNNCLTGNIINYVKDIRLNDIDLIICDRNLEQESNKCKYYHEQILIILRILPTGKNSIFKMYIPFTKPLTISLLYLIACVFKEVKVIKPLISSSISTEVYIVCKIYSGYDKIPITLRNKLSYLMFNFDSKKCLFPINSISQKFINDLINCSNIFIKKQINAINRVLWYKYYLYSDLDVQRNIEHLRNKSLEDWIKMYEISEIDNSDRLTSK